MILRASSEAEHIHLLGGIFVFELFEKERHFLDIYQHLTPLSKTVHRSAFYEGIKGFFIDDITPCTLYKILKRGIRSLLSSP